MSLLIYIVIIVIFTITDAVLSPFVSVFALMSGFALGSAGAPDIIVLFAIFGAPVIMNIIPVGIVIAVNRKKYMYNEISLRECIISDVVFALVKIAVTYAVFTTSLRL